MEQNSTSVRLHALDGIRGLAILLVVFNHVNGAYLTGVIPSWLGTILFGSGVTGVSLLFALSGFLMAYIYPNPKSASHFLQKRYTRIFPLFVTSCVLMLTIRELPMIAWYWQLFFMLFFAFIAHTLWVHVIKRFASTQFKKYIFLGFVFLQIIVGSFYLFWVMRHPAIVFNQQLPVYLREGTVGLVNATLTLPLGDYIPMLEGVYWSLVSEVLFYILYPFICAPIVNFMIPQKRWLKVALLIALMPFFAGMDILSHKIFVLSMLQLPICYYFVVGIVLGYLFKHHEEKIMNLHRFFPGRLSIFTVILFVLIVTVKLFVLNVSGAFLAWVHILWAFPIIFMMALSLDQKTFLAKILSSRPLVFLGTVSYSIYLAHSPLVHLVMEAFPATNLATNILQLVLTLALTIVISSLWYFLLERPYFKRDKVKDEVKISHPSAVARFVRRPAFLFPAVIFLYIAAIFGAYESSFNFFSTQLPVKNVIFANPQIPLKQTKLSLRDYPKIDFTFTSNEDNFEILTLHIMHDPIPNIVDSPQWLNFHIKEVGQKQWYATDNYNLARIKDDVQQPFGFPLISNAKNKNYQVELALSNPSYPQYITLDRSSINGIYKTDKVALLKHPLQMLQFIYAKILTVVLNVEAKEIFLLFLPLVFILLLVSFPRRRTALIT